MKKLTILLVVSVLIGLIGLCIPIATSCTSVPTVQEVELQFLTFRQQEDLNRCFKNIKTDNIVCVKAIYFCKRKTGDIRHDIMYRVSDDSGKIQKISFVRFHTYHKRIKK